MGTLWNKLNSLLTSIDDIQAAINEKKVKVDSTIPLGKYGDKIREIETGGMWADYITIKSFPSFTEKDLKAKIILDVSDSIKIGTMAGIKSRDYITIKSFPSFTEKDLIVKELKDITDTMTITKNTYTTL